MLKEEGQDGPESLHRIFSKLEELADDTCKFDENGKKFFKRVENTVGKRRNCSLRAISPFLAEFSKDLLCRRAKTRAYLGKG